MHHRKYVFHTRTISFHKIIGLSPSLHPSMNMLLTPQPPCVAGRILRASPLPPSVCQGRGAAAAPPSPSRPPHWPYATGPWAAPTGHGAAPPSPPRPSKLSCPSGPRTVPPGPVAAAAATATHEPLDRTPVPAAAAVPVTADTPAVQQRPLGRTDQTRGRAAYLHPLPMMNPSHTEQHPPPSSSKRPKRRPPTPILVGLSLAYIKK